jgi:hypothetical protein
MELSFKAPIDDVDINGLNEFLKLPKLIDTDIEKSTANVEYVLDPQLRNWGINFISVLPRRVSYTLQWTVNDAEDLSLEERAAIIAAGGIEMRNNTFEGTIEVDSKEQLNGQEWQLNCEIDFGANGSFQIDTVEIDFSKMTISLT